MILSQLSRRRWAFRSFCAAGLWAIAVSAWAVPLDSAELPLLDQAGGIGAPAAPAQLDQAGLSSEGEILPDAPGGPPVQPEPVLAAPEEWASKVGQEGSSSEAESLDGAEKTPAETAQAPVPEAMEPLPIQPVPSAQEPDPVTFDMADVEKKAQELASQPYQNPYGQVPDFLLSLSEDLWSTIKFRPEAGLWRHQDRTFEIQFFHPGLVYDRLVEINVIDGGVAQPWPFSPGQFIYPDGDLAAKVTASKISYAGFQILCPRGPQGQMEPLALFLGASYFRAAAGDSSFGLSARGLALETGLPKGEEFPYFREFWIEKPAAGAPSLTVYALLDSPSATGAYRFVITPGAKTVIDTDCSLYLRSEPEKLGLAPLTTMFFYGEEANGRPGDFRPEVHNSDGLLLKKQEGHWIWRPLSNPSRLKISSFSLEEPQGFGLLQRDNDFDHYQDLDGRYEKRPSLWIEPKGSWRSGQVELIEIPSNREIYDNVVAFWVPNKPAKLDANGAPMEGLWAYPEKMSLSYRMSWLPSGELPQEHELGRVTSTRRVEDAEAGTTRFILDFEGPALEQIEAGAGLASEITLTGDGKILDKDLRKNEATGGWRLSFLLSQPQPDKLSTLIPQRDPRGGLRIAAVLKKGDNFPDPLTEVWVWDKGM